MQILTHRISSTKSLPNKHRRKMWCRSDWHWRDHVMPKVQGDWCHEHGGFVMYPVSPWKRTRWWFQILFIFTAIWGRFLFLTNIFQRGWNHQLVKECQLLKWSFQLRKLASIPVPLFFMGTFGYFRRNSSGVAAGDRCFFPLDGIEKQFERNLPDRKHPRKLTAGSQ